MWSSAACLGEMAALLPVKGPIFEFPRRFLDESLGYAAGWMTWYGPTLTPPTIAPSVLTSSKVLLDCIDRCRASCNNAYLPVQISSLPTCGSRLPRFNP